MYHVLATLAVLFGYIVLATSVEGEYKGLVMALYILVSGIVYALLAISERKH